MSSYFLNNPKENMMLLQLESRDISNKIILNAFKSIDRDDFVPVQFKRSLYQDIEIEANDRIMLRCYVLARVLEILLKKDVKKILVVGDTSGYTSSIFSNVFENCFVGSVFLSELSELRSRLSDIKVMYFKDIIMNKQNKFDAIFLDGGFYKKSTIINFKDSLKENGETFFFSKPLTSNINPEKYSITEVLFNSINFENEEKILFNMNLYFPNSFVC